jgi:hypothetical protein
VTLRTGFRRRYNLGKGDAVVFKRAVEGLPIGPEEAHVMKLLDGIDQGL